jgi:hypothetical protein
MENSSCWEIQFMSISRKHRIPVNKSIICSRRKAVRLVHRGIIPLLLLFMWIPAFSQANSTKPGSRSLMDAHNCYPYFEWWADRIDRALSAGVPLAIEQDLDWYTDPQTGRSWSVVAHGAPLTGHEPTLEQYFFERVRPVIEKALQSEDHRDWPIITLNLDFKSEQPEHLAEIWSLLEKHRAWLTSASRTEDARTLQPLDVKPILVLTGESEAQETAFYAKLPVGSRLLVFGAVRSNTKDPMAPPEVLVPEAATNYRRWWNNAWNVVERGGQTQAGDWTAEDDARLRTLVRFAHAHNLWIRFYTLDGVTKEDLSCHGWFRSYNFGSLEAVRQRWRAALAAGVDYIASDQYEQLAQHLKTP